MAETKQKTIYELDLHETISVEIMRGPWTVTRVPSGWIYQNDSPSITIPVGFFVPFDNRFQWVEPLAVDDLW